MSNNKNTDYKRQLEELADQKGELVLHSLIWFMLDMLPKSKQKKVIEEAKRILKKY